MTKWVGAGAVLGAVALIAIGFLVGRLTDEGDDDAGGDADVSEQDENALDVGDWVRVDNAGGCLEVLIEFLQPGGPSGAVPICTGEGTALPIAAGPEEVEGEDYWLLTGVGWAPEGDLTFDHTGLFPYPERPELGSEGLIAFVAPDGDLWLMDADGSDQRRLAAGPVRASPMWSPDGQMIAYFSGESLIIVNLGGEELLRDAGPFTWGATGSEQAHWSPDSTMIAARKGGSVVVLGLDGRMLLEVENAEEPSWSSDSARLAFLVVEPDDQSALYYPSVGAWASLSDGVVHRLESEASFESYADGPPIWRPGSPTQLAYRNRLIGVDSGETVVEFPGTIVAWTADGMQALLGIDEQGILGHHFVLFDPSSPASEGVRSFLNLVSCQCDAPNWVIGRDEIHLSPLGGYALLKETDTQAATPGVMELHPTGRQGRFGPLSTLGGTVAGFSPDEGFVLLWKASSSGSDDPGAWPVAIWAVDLESSEITFLANGWWPAWQPSIAASASS